MPLKILFLVPYFPGKAPSQRFRFEQYFGLIKERGWDYQLKPFGGSTNRNYFLESGQKKGIISFFSKGIWRRFLSLFSLNDVDVVFIHREAAPIGPPILEFIISRILKKRIIYDFDDAIWLSDRQHESRAFRLLKWRSKVGRICSMAYRVSCGNHFLADFALRHNTNVVVNPTTIDTENLHNPNLYPARQQSNRIIIGWTGSFSTLKYLALVEAAIREVQHAFNHVDFLVIADEQPALNISRMEFLSWNPDSEVRDLNRIDIGIMPLPDDEWSKGKCGFKILQYMAMEIPAVTSPVGVNIKIVENGIDGFFARSTSDWIEKLSQLIQDHDLRRSMGERGRTKVQRFYSINSNSTTFLSLFE